jgi:hypothetical protein
MTMLVRKILLAAAMLQLMIVPGMTRVARPDSPHRYQGGPKTEEHVLRNSRAAMEYNIIGSYVSQYNSHQYHGGPKGQ